MEKSINTLTILLYHGVTDVKSVGIENYSTKHIPIDSFEKQMILLKKKYNIISMDEVVFLNKNNKKYPPNAVAVTFDDGFRNNYTNAAPILTSFNIPATFYITAGIVNTDLMFWVDKIEDCINNSKQNSIKIDLDKDYIFDVSSYNNKINTLNTIKDFCKKIKKAQREAIVNQVISECFWQPDINSSKNYEKIKWHELYEMSANSLFTIGAHSLYHEILSSIESKKELKDNIETSIKLLEYNLEKKIIHYSYPEGQHNHYNSEIIDILKNNNIECSPSAIYGINIFGKDDLFNLKRIMVGFNNTKFPLD